MTIRIIGAILIVIGCSSVGFLMAHSYRKEISILSEFADFLNMLECELQYRSPPVALVIKSFAGEKKGELCVFLRQLSKELDSQIRPSVESCVNAAISKVNDLPKQTEVYVRKLGATLGLFDIEGQILEIQALRKEVIDKLAFMQKNQSTQVKNYKTLGICAGAALAILFI